MLNKFLLVAGLIFFGIVVVLGISTVSKRADKSEAAMTRQNAVDERLVEPPSASDRLISKAQAAIERAPNAHNGYNMLAVAYLQKARETGDYNFNVRAEAALAQSLKLAPDNYEAIKLQSKLLVIYHRFGEGFEMARRALQQQPKDYEVWGTMTDALVELGRYEDAAHATQTMVDLRPYTGSYARVSYLRSLHGDTQGAIEAMRLALQSASPADPESIAWCAVHLGDELMNAGKVKEAEHEYDRALFSFPDYPLAFAAKARARLAAGDIDQAVMFYQRAQERVPSPDIAIALSDLYTKLGRSDEAQKQYQLVELTERIGNQNSATYSRQIALFWADRGTRLDEALAIARRERAERADIYASDVLAWCLYKKGEFAEARKSIDEAMRLGTRDARILYHAGMIYKALGKSSIAEKRLKLALEINPTFDVLQAEVAKQALLDIKA